MPQTRPTGVERLPNMDNRIFGMFVYMVRTTVKPQKQDISIHVPANYVGRELEVLLYPVDEITEEKPVKKSLASLRGALHPPNTGEAQVSQPLNPGATGSWQRATAML